MVLVILKMSYGGAHFFSLYLLNNGQSNGQISNGQKAK